MKPTANKPLPDKKLKILFIARTYPPLVGGMERFASDFYRYLGELTDVHLIANRIGKKHVPWFFLRVCFYLIFNAKQFDLIHFNDAILTPLIPIIRLFSKARVTVTVHGLDVIYDKLGYQKLVIPFLRKADRIFPVSQYTKEQCLKRNITEDRLHVIPNGLDFSQITECVEADKQNVLSRIKGDIAQKTVLLSLGRLIERKGHFWFIQNVFPHLPENVIYLIAGDGPEFDKINALVQDYAFEDRIFMLGYVSDGEKNCLFDLADLFIMPNIIDPHDQEGFGIVLLEAGSHNLPSIATKIEGIPDAVIDGVSGFLVEEKDAQGFIDAILKPKIQRENIAAHLRAKYDWEIISKTYHKAFISLGDQK